MEPISVRAAKDDWKRRNPERQAEYRRRWLAGNVDLNRRQARERARRYRLRHRKTG